MSSCLKPSTLSTSTSNNRYSSSHGFSSDNTPTSSVQLSPTVNLSHEYARAIQTNSYTELRRIFYPNNSSSQTVDVRHVDVIVEPRLLEQVLRPDREHVRQALSLIGPNPLTDLISTYFEHSEHTSRLCLLLYESIRRARFMYTPIHKLLDDLPLDPNSDDGFSLSYSQCVSAFNVFHEFDRFENPFTSLNTQSFVDIRNSFSQLKQELDRHLRKSRSKVNLIRGGSKVPALCLITAVVGVAVSAVVIATHALAALIACPICVAAVTPSSMLKKELVHLAQIDAAAKGVYVLLNDTQTIDRLVTRVQGAVEHDKILIKMGLERGVESHPVEQVLKMFRRNRQSFVQQLADFEEHLLLCFAGTNRARTLLLQEIQMHQNQP